MLKRIFDLSFSIIALLLLSPILVGVMVTIWLSDFHSPLYIASRVGKGGNPFKMAKLRSMIPDADKKGIFSTASDDQRITRIGRLIRRYKLDEFCQLWNVLVGNMSLVGPRPNVVSEVQRYTENEKKILSVVPGMTDFSSIVFSDENEILEGKSDPDSVYNELIRPWKSRLALIYIETRSFSLDLKLIACTVVNFISRKHALEMVKRLLQKRDVSEDILRVVTRENKLEPFPPP